MMAAKRREDPSDPLYIPPFLRRTKKGGFAEKRRTSASERREEQRPRRPGANYLGVAPKRMTVIEQAMLDPRFETVPERVWRELPRSAGHDTLEFIFMLYRPRPEGERSAAPRVRPPSVRDGLVSLRAIANGMVDETGAAVWRSDAVKILKRRGWKKPKFGWYYTEKDAAEIRGILEKALKKGEVRRKPLSKTTEEED